jgi:hypothetical protein
MTVRIAVPEDEEAIVGLCAAAHAEQGEHPLDLAKLRAFIHRGISLENAIVGVIGPVGAPLAYIIILVDPVWYSGDWQLLELTSFVHPSARKAFIAADGTIRNPTLGKELIAFAKRCADETGLHLTIGVMSNIRTEAKVRLYERQLPKAGAFFVYRPEAAPMAAAG